MQHLTLMLHFLHSTWRFAERWRICNVFERFLERLGTADVTLLQPVAGLLFASRIPLEGSFTPTVSAGPRQIPGPSEDMLNLRVTHSLESRLCGEWMGTVFDCIMINYCELIDVE